MAVEVTRSLDRFMRKTAEAVGRVNGYVGEQFISDARQIDTYVDKTAALRNSIGYVRTFMGKPEGQEFSGKYTKAPAKGAKDRSKEGRTEGARYAAEQAKGIDNGLIMVAGMSYAAPVEAKGYDVITESVKRAKENHKRQMQKTLKV